MAGAFICLAGSALVRLLGAVRRNSAHRGVDDSVESVRYCALPALQRVIRAGVIAATGMQNKLPYGQLYAKPV
jgi:hypothetical protein